MDRSDLLGERRLALAVLEQAVSDATAQGHNYRTAHLRHDAQDWLDGRTQSPLSAELLCGVLGIEHDVLRSQVQEGKFHVKRYGRKLIRPSRARELDEF